jgi:hypothetical protein
MIKSPINYLWYLARYLSAFSDTGVPNLFCEFLFGCHLREILHQDMFFRPIGNFMYPRDARIYHLQLPILPRDRSSKIRGKISDDEGWAGNWLLSMDSKHEPNQ